MLYRTRGAILVGLLCISPLTMADARRLFPPRSGNFLVTPFFSESVVSLFVVGCVTVALARAK